MSAAVTALVEDGVVLPDFRLPEPDCSALLDAVKATRTFGPELFLDEATFDAAPVYKGVNPRAGRNLVEDLDEQVARIANNPRLVALLESLLGEGYVTLFHKIVCGIPERWVPPWLRSRILGNAVNNLGPFVRPEHRDITYFYGIDFHQDLIDWPGREADFVTVYVYLHPVTERDAPLHVLPGSHRFGATRFPHALQREPGPPVSWRYASGRGQSAVLPQRKLTGPTGTVAMWHAATLHGTQPDKADHERISLRLMYARSGSTAEVGMDRVNATLDGPLALPRTRVDLAEDGNAAVRTNAINRGREEA
jgi:hypothetical protein